MVLLLLQVVLLLLLLQMVVCGQVAVQPGRQPRKRYGAWRGRRDVAQVVHLLVLLAVAALDVVVVVVLDVVGEGTRVEAVEAIELALTAVPACRLFARRHGGIPLGMEGRSGRGSWQLPSRVLPLTV